MWFSTVGLSTLMHIDIAFKLGSLWDYGISSVHAFYDILRDKSTAWSSFLLWSLTCFVAKVVEIS